MIAQYDMASKKDATSYGKYCPVCGRWLRPSNQSEYESGRHSNLIFVHDNIPHDVGDIKAFGMGVQ